MTQSKMTHGHAHCPHPVPCPENAPCRLCRIEVDKLSVTMGKQVLLKDVSLHIHCGELTALIGTNGAGKTTLLRALLGQVEYKGTVRHLTSDGRPAADLRTGYVPQQLEFDRSSPVTVMDFVAAALTPQPDLLILDEPVSGVDQNGLEAFYQTVDELKHKNHMAILLVSHDLGVVEHYADRVVLMQGTVIKQGSPEVVFDSPEFEQVFYAKGGRA